MTYIGITRSFAQHPKRALVFSLVVAIVSLMVAITSWSHLQTLPDEPESSSLSQIASKLENQSSIWVTIPSVEWDCNNVVQYTNSTNDYQTDAVFTNAERTVMGVATFSGQKTCEQIMQSSLTGEVYIMGEEYRAKLPSRGFDMANYSKTTTFINICTHCGRGNSTIGVWAGAIMTIVGLSIYPMSLSRNRRYRLTGRLPYDRY